MAARDFDVVQSKAGIIDVSPNHPVRMTEVVFVMSVDASERNDGSDRVASAPCPTRALLITGARWRHVAQGYARQGSDIDAYLHRRCAREDIDCGPGSSRIVRTQINILKQQLVFLCL